MTRDELDEMLKDTILVFDGMENLYVTYLGTYEGSRVEVSYYHDFHDFWDIYATEYLHSLLRPSMAVKIGDKEYCFD